jgi:hypothetical protein
VKIRSKDGEIIDLARVRTRYEAAVADRSYPIGTIATKQDLALLDALEAACSVQPVNVLRDAQVDEEFAFHQGRNDGIRECRQAAGVIEE